MAGSLIDSVPPSNHMELKCVINDPDPALIAFKTSYLYVSNDKRIMCLYSPTGDVIYFPYQ